MSGEIGPAPIPGDGELFQRLLTVRASLDMILGGLPLMVLEPLIEQARELFEGHAGTHLRSSPGRWLPTSLGRRRLGMRFQVPDLALESSSVGGFLGAVTSTRQAGEHRTSGCPPSDVVLLADSSHKRSRGTPSEDWPGSMAALPTNPEKCLSLVCEAAFSPRL